MRRLSAICLTVFLISATFSAKSQGKFRLGLKIAPNIGWIKSVDGNVESDGTNVKFGYGLVGDINFSERYALSTGISVTKIGFNTKYDSASVISVKTTNVNQYIEIPLVLKLKTNEIGYLTYFGKFGLGTGVLIKSEYEQSGTVNGFDIDGSGNAKSITQPVRLSLLVGLGAEYNISGNTSLLFGLDFNNGFTRNFKKKSVENGNAGTSAENVTSSYVGINIGVLF